MANETTICLRRSISPKGSFTHEIGEWVRREDQDYEANKIVTGKVLEIRGDDVVIDIGYKSEGVIKLDEWKEEGSDAPPPKPALSTQVQQTI